MRTPGFTALFTIALGLLVPATSSATAYDGAIDPLPLQITLPDGRVCHLKRFSTILLDGWTYDTMPVAKRTWVYDCVEFHDGPPTATTPPKKAKKPEHGALLTDNQDALALLVNCGEDGIIVCSVSKPKTCVCPNKKKDKPSKERPAPDKLIPA